MKQTSIKLLLLGIVVFGLFFFATNNVYARLLPRYRGKSTGSTSASAQTRLYYGVTVAPRFTAGRGGLIVYFGNLQNATSVSYMFSYETNGKPEGISGTIDPSSRSTYRNLYFGTCSTGVCTAHMNITNAHLEVRSKLTNGKTSIKRFRIRV